MNNQAQILVLGATGKVGAKVIELLQKAGKNQIIAGVRSIKPNRYRKKGSKFVI